LERVLQPHPKTAPTYLKPLAAAIIPRGQRVLMTERRYPGYGEVWSWPSGKIEKNETLEEALLRELHEELLIADAHIVRHIGDIDLPSGYRMSHFLTSIPESVQPRLNDYEQLVQVQWMTRDEVERALATLPPHIAERALEFVDQVLAAQPDVAAAGSPSDESPAATRSSPP
jgi:8-oxo-dGTP pyrophosphatase MutT (NUDIX family)